MPNRLIDETSLYLLQHANNPVDWYPWGDEAFADARERDVPVLLSVGYSSCHWCHVMERESFENPQIAAMMNEMFVSVKVDREERPDVDSVYMTAVQAMTGHGGWPMTVFLTADGSPFYGGTYFPPEDRGGMPAFPRVLATIADAFQNRRADVLSSGRQIVNHINQTFASARGVEPLTDAILRAAFEQLTRQFDDRSGGFGLQPKFPQPQTLEFLLRYHRRTGMPLALEMLELTLDKMAAGGMYDQIGGGFHRYSTDAFWLVPHFEKMLYDNALLARLYTHAYQATRNPSYAKVAQGILDYVLREMRHPDGGFYAAQDADSEGVEGKFFVWRPEQLVRVLGNDAAQVVADYFGVTNEGNFEGMTVLNVPNPPVEVAARHSMSPAELDALIESASARLLEERSQRIPPLTDTKIITSWNGLMMAAMAEAGAALGRDDYIRAAQDNAAFILERMAPDDRLRRTDGDSQNGAQGFLDDYSHLIDGLLALHASDGDLRWLIEAEKLTRQAVALFWDPLQSRFYDTGSDQENLIIRPRDVTDNALPSGHSMITGVLIRLSIITGDADLRTMASDSLRSVRDIMLQFPTGAGHWLCALDFYLSDHKEAVIITPSATHRGPADTLHAATDTPASQRGPADTPSIPTGTPAATDTPATTVIPAKAGIHSPPPTGPAQMLRRLASTHLTGAIILSAPQDAADASQWPVFQGRAAIDNKPTAYICRNYACQLPTTNPDTMLSQLLS